MRPITERGRKRYRAYRRRRADDRAWSGVGLPPRVAPPRRIVIPEPDRRLRLNRRRLDSFTRQSLILVGVAAFAGFLLLWWGWRTTRVGAALTGVEDGAALKPAEASALAFRIEVSPGGRLDDATLSFNGRDVLPGAKVRGDAIEWSPGPLEEGEYRLRLTVPRPILPDAARTWDFAVDGTPPQILVPPYLPPHGMKEKVEIEGHVDGGDRFLVNGRPHDLDGDGDFRLEYSRPPPGPVELVAEDEAGNRRTAQVSVPMPYRAVHGIHVTAQAWENPPSRQQILELIDAGLIDTVELDIKDEGGVVGHETAVPLAGRAGASAELYDLGAQVDLLHEKDVWVVGRIVAFRDPVLADWAWTHGRRDLVIQTPEGERYGAYDGGFTSFASPDVQEYNIALAEEAVKAGVDDIMYDYVRRPEGDLEAMVVPGLKGAPEDAIVGFLGDSHDRLRRLGAYQGAAVFGVAATRPEQSGQNILAMAYHTDYVAPMLYPSHWNVGEFGIPDPEREPYEIVKRSLRDFQQAVTRTGRPLVPWIQHFSLRVTYGTEDVVAQVQAVKDTGYDSWMMWDPLVTYDVKALEESRRLTAAG